MNPIASSIPAASSPGILLAQADGARQLVPFEQLPHERQLELRGIAEGLLILFGGPGNASVAAGATPQIDYRDFASILRNIAERSDLNDLEKAYVWSTLADWKGEANNLTSRFENAHYQISLDGARSEVRDSQPFREWNTSNHAVLNFRDTYHGFGEPGESLAYLDRDAAARAVRAHESFAGVNLNPGDTNASIALAEAFIAYREAPWGSKFDAFADAWIRGFVE